MKKIFLSIAVALLSFGSLTHASSWGGYGSSEGPINWGSWYLYQSNIGTYWIECVYKRKEIKTTSGGSIRTEEQRLQIARYPYGKCSDSISS